MIKKDPRDYIVGVAKAGIIQADVMLNVYLQTFPGAEKEEIAKKLLLYLSACKELISKLND